MPCNRWQNLRNKEGLKTQFKGNKATIRAENIVDKHTLMDEHLQLFLHLGESHIDEGFFLGK